jgi:hypothetical protein
MRLILLYNAIYLSQSPVGALYVYCPKALLQVSTYQGPRELTLPLIKCPALHGNLFGESSKRS